jgi:tetratricopeptide (TPR) repeat protein
LLAGAGLVILARGRSEPRELGAWVRGAAVAGAVVLTGLALWSLLAAVPLGRAREALLRGDWPSAISNAKKAERWAPWASDPWRYRGEAELALGDVAAARESFRTSVEKEPGEWLNWLQLAVTTGGEEQLEALERAKALNPSEEQIRIVEESARNPAPAR